jgi:hypothetical protein
VFYITQVWCWARPIAVALLNALSTRPAAALLATPTVKLYTAGPTPVHPTNVVGDFTEATFTGYAAVVLGAWSGVVNLPNQDGQGIHQDATFTAGAIVGPGQNILGYWMDDGAGNFQGGEAFPAPIPINILGDFLSIDVFLPQLNPQTL